MIDLSTLLEIRLKSEEDFLKVRETLTRIGVASHKDKTLYQSCHILHKKGKYYIVHFKEMFLLDGKHSDISDADYARRNAIAKLLQEWGLIEIALPDQIAANLAPLHQIKIIPFKEKHDWTLCAKYTIGKKSIKT
jgi:hypothetical protein